MEQDKKAVVIRVVLDFLVSELTDYKDLSHICSTFNCALDALSQSGLESEQYKRYLDSIDKRRKKLIAAYYEKKNLESARLP